MTRSSISSARDSFVRDMRALSNLVGANVSVTNLKGGWNADLNSELLSVMTEEYSRILLENDDGKTGGKELDVGAIHAGLETGVITDRLVEYYGENVEALRYLMSLFVFLHFLTLVFQQKKNSLLTVSTPRSLSTYEALEQPSSTSTPQRKGWT